MADINIWMVAALIMMLALIPCTVVCARGSLSNRLVGLEMGTIVTILFLLLFAQAIGRPAFFDLALSLAVLSFPGTLLFAHFLERFL